MTHVDFQAHPRDFLRQCGDILEKDEVEHNLILTLCHNAVNKKTDIRCGILREDEDGAFVLAAVQAPPHNLVLSKAAHPEVEQLAMTLAEKKFSFPGIVGPSDVAGAFSSKWAEVTGQHSVEYMDQIIYLLKHAILPPGAEGEMRFAKKSETDIAAQWIYNFSESALPKAERLSETQAKTQAEDLIATQRLAFWTVRGKPVAQASFSGTENVARINRVYTPPENRGKGYASAVVAHLSRLQLDEGRRLCCLYADARNTQANSIYRKIGYEFAGRSSLYVLQKAA